MDEATEVACVLSLDTGLTVTIPPRGSWAPDDDFADLNLRRGASGRLSDRVRDAELAVMQLNRSEFELLRALLGVGHRPTPERAAWRRRFLVAAAALEPLEAAAIDFVLATDGPVIRSWRAWESPAGLADGEFQSRRPKPDPSPFEEIEAGADAARKRAIVAGFMALSMEDRRRFLDRFAAAAEGTTAA